MGSLEQNTTLIYGIHIRESANDGSDFSNGATDYRVLFLGEDGKLHVKDSAGTVSDPFTAGSGTGQGLVDFASLVYTTGDITCDADSVWEDLAGPGDLTITASSGQWVEVGVSFSCTNTTAVSINFDVGTIVSAAVVNHISTGAAPDNAKNGIGGWRVPANAAYATCGSILYQLQAGDITGGTVVLRLRDRPSSSTNRDIQANTNTPLHFWAKNLGGSL